MISDNKLKKISLLVAVIGIIMIYAATVLLESLIIEIKNITERDVGKNVAVNGTVNSYSISNGNIFIDLSDSSGNITVVMFERTARGQQLPELKKDVVVIVKGQISIYKSGLEIIANSIKAV